jgi:hypothetical protein
VLARRKLRRKFRAREQAPKPYSAKSLNLAQLEARPSRSSGLTNCKPSARAARPCLKVGENTAIFLTDRKRFGAMLLMATGSESHVHAPDRPRLVTGVTPLAPRPG